MFEYIYQEEQRPWRKKRRINTEDETTLWPIPADIIPPTPSTQVGASVINLSKVKKPRIPKSAMMLDDPNVEFITYAAGTITAWDNDAENQKDTSFQFKFDSQVEREGTNFIIFPFINDWTSDVDGQRDFSWQFKFDSQEEREATNFIILPPADWTLDADQQFDTSWHITDDILDASVELIVVPIVVPLFVLGGGQVILLANPTGGAIPAVNATGGSQLIINVNAEVINSGDK